MARLKRRVPGLYEKYLSDNSIRGSHSLTKIKTKTNVLAHLREWGVQQSETEKASRLMDIIYKCRRCIGLIALRYLLQYLSHLTTTIEMLHPRWRQTVSGR